MARRDGLIAGINEQLTETAHFAHSDESLDELLQLHNEVGQRQTEAIERQRFSQRGKLVLQYCLRQNVNRKFDHQDYPLLPLLERTQNPTRRRREVDAGQTLRQFQTVIVRDMSGEPAPDSFVDKVDMSEQPRIEHTSSSKPSGAVSVSTASNGVLVKRIEWRCATLPKEKKDIFYQGDMNSQQGGAGFAFFVLAANEEAKAVCEQCATKEECLELAVSRDEKFGIWGGLTTYQRKKLRKGR